MKALLALLVSSVLPFGAVSAETIAFLGSPCSAYRECAPVLTDQADNTVYLFARLNTRPVVVIDGISYTGTVFDKGGQLSLAQPAIAADGSQIYLVVNFTHSTKKINQGRAHYYIQIWSITDGYVTR